MQAYEHGMAISIVALRGSIPSQYAVDFKTSIGKYCGFSLDQRSQLADIYKELSDTSGKNKRSAGLADVATLGDAWLGPAIARGLVQSIPGAETYRWHRLLPPRLQQLVRRDARGQYDPHGQVYGAPYRWGATLLLYRKDRLLRRGGWPLLDWSDLMQPLLRGRVAMVDSPRELVAVALRTLIAEREQQQQQQERQERGQQGSKEGAVAGRRDARLSVNASAAELAAAGITEDVLRERVAALRAQVRLFSSRDHIRALQAGDVWAVVGSSQDLVLVAERGSSMELVAPLSGTQLWADVWAVPAGARGGNRQEGPSPLLPVWFEFTLSPGRITGQPGLKAGAPAALLDAQWPPSEPQPHTSTHSNTSSSSTSSTGGSHASAEEVLGAIREHRQHLEERRRRQEEEGSLMGMLARARTALTPALERLQGRVGAGAAGEGEEGQGQARVVAAWAAEGQEEQGARGRYPDVALSNANAYLPPPVVLARSEFLNPLDEETAELYRRVLAASAPQ